MLTRAAYSVSREAASKGYAMPDIKADPDESMGFMLLKPKSEFFLDWEYTHHVRLPGAKRAMPYSCWLAKGDRAQGNRIMVILPGLGGHRLGNGVVALAELYANAGWSVIAFSSTMHPEFFRALPEPNLPGNLRKDAQWLGQAISCALADFGMRHREYAAQKCAKAL